MESKKAIFREAKARDIRQLVALADKLLRFETPMAGWKVVEEPDDRYKILYSSMAAALIDSGHKIYVVDKAGHITAMFIVRIQYQHPIFTHQTFCDVWLAYSRKSAMFLRKLEGEVLKWMSEKQCHLMKVTVLTKNERVKKLLSAMKFRAVHEVFEREV